MSVIYMRHDVHGTKVACSDDEAKADEKNGWKRYEVGTLLTPEKVEAQNVASLPDVDLLRARYQEKFGRKPHHKLSVESLQRELQAA